MSANLSPSHTVSWKNMLENVSMSRVKREKRRHLRHTVAVFCRAIVDGRDYVGKVVNLSSSGMAVDFDDDLGAQAITTGSRNHRSIRPKAGHALTFKLDLSKGADHPRSRISQRNLRPTMRS